MSKATSAYLIKTLVCILIIFLFFFFIPPVNPITHKGMQLIGLFLAMIFGWTFIDTVLPSIIGLIALIFVDGMNVQSAITNSVGQAQVMFLFMTFILVEMVNKERLAKLIADNILSIKFIQGKPIFMSIAILIIATILGIINVFMSVLLTWAIVYEICKEFNIKPYEKYAVTMITGVALCSSMGLVTLPFQDSGLILTGMFSQVFGPLNYFKYLAVVIPIQVFLITIWMLGSKYIMKVDFNQLNGVDKSALATKATKRQKYTILIIVIFVGLLLAKGSLPAEWLFTQLLTRLDIFGIACVTIIIGCLINVDGTPMINFIQYAKDGVLWNIFFLSGVVMAIAGMLTAEDTGVSPFIIQNSNALLQNLSPIAFTIILLLLSFLMTNFINNIVVGSIVISLLVPLSQIIAFNPEAVGVLIIIVSHFALLTPAASGTAAMLYGNKEWVDMKSIYKFALPLMALGVLFVSTIGVMWSNLIF